MIAILLIALAAGCASALMFASIISGALISLLLFYLAPLPLMVAALGWGPIAATIGGIAAASGLGVIFGLPYCIAFAITIAVPAWWLGHLALLGRPLPDAASGNGSAPAAPQFEWYPAGRILLWIAGFGALTTIAAMLTLGSDAETITAALRSGLTRILGARDPASSGDIERWVAALAIIAPAAATIVAMMTLTLNLWLAGKITVTSGRLHRPWPDLKSAELPPMTLVALSVALAFCFVGGLTAIFAQIATTALMMAYALIGFAVLHTLTLSLNSRGFWLCCAYAVVVTFGWPVLAMIALGLADAVFGIRQRYLSGKPPPLPAS
ncbi:hypothetical protein ACFIOY_23995 [Bradyrhizobium sp. TZ2]